jgi:hypothetical protein
VHASCYTKVSSCACLPASSSLRKWKMAQQTARLAAARRKADATHNQTPHPMTEPRLTKWDSQSDCKPVVTELASTTEHVTC